MDATTHHGAERPPSIPPSARYNPEHGTFELVETDADGRPSGECSVYRASDGSLLSRCRYAEGVKDGPFTVFHPNGEPAQRGLYRGGQLDGDVVAYGSDAPTELTLRPCCVPPGAWELRTQYRQGLIMRQVFLDRAGYPISADGSRWPDRPAGITGEADYDQGSQRWLVREEDEASASFIDRYFTRDGKPFQEIEIRAGARYRELRYDALGRPSEERHIDPQGRFHGPSIRWFPDPEASPYLDPRVRKERGQYAHGHPVGAFEGLDADGALVVRRELGAALDEASLGASPALAEDLAAWDAERVWALARELLQGGRAREACCAAARAAVRGGGRERLAAFLSAATLQSKPEVAERRGRALIEAPDVTALGVVDELLLGAEPSAAYRTLAAVFRGSRRVALSLVEAALLLMPERRSTYITRALLRLELGDTRGVLEDADRVEPEAAAVAEHLRTFVRLLFPEFAFWPTRQAIDPVPGDASDTFELGQPIEQVREKIQLYATRLLRLREAVQRSLPGAEPCAWLPPDLSRLLPDGPVELARTAATLTEETENGVETVELTVDETLDTGALPVSLLMRRARAEWAALCWLCWSAGLDRVALPERIAHRPDFTAAVNTSLTRWFRARDQLQSGGLISRARGVPGFIWEGHDIDQLDPALTAIAIDEYFEMRCLFVWLLFRENISPFQSDIRAA
ncbi:toxin-antitoxin system YwqK family antitoxin [Sorangium sp. So ce1000]|uniref:toxin-antitoxin system YwqK family antitoxin n=1 Tax=Sorangium sp. So ce1000 TaxID=3133325 RepID=UPI003F5DEF0C